MQKIAKREKMKKKLKNKPNGDFEGKINFAHFLRIIILLIYRRGHS